MKRLAKKMGVKHRVVSSKSNDMDMPNSSNSARFLLFPPSKVIKGVDKVRRGA